VKQNNGNIQTLTLLSSLSQSIGRGKNEYFFEVFSLLPINWEKGLGDEG